MKSENILKKIINNVKKNNNEMIKLLYDLKNSMEKEHVKNNEEIIKKISTLYNLDEEQLSKRFLKKNKKKNLIQSEESDIFLNTDMEKYEEYSSENENEEQEEYEEQDEIVVEKKEESPQILKKTLINDQEYFYEEKKNGKVYKREHDSFSIVGNYDLQEKQINLT